MLNFADLDSGVWGVAWDLGADRSGVVLIGDRAGFASPEAALTGTWEISGDEVDLESVAEELAGVDQLIAVRGRLRLNGTEHRIDCLGRRGLRADLDPLALESVRDVSAWFAPEDGLALTAARSPGSTGQEDDRLTASFFEGGRLLAIAEPRLSTTYGADGSPIHAGLELWPEPPADQDGTDHTPSYPRRAAGEAAGSPATATAGSLSIEARLFRWHSHGHEGAGMYVLARLR
jgi:hypothetical protein